MNKINSIRCLSKLLLSLVILNFVTGIMHIIFQFYLIKSTGIYREFLLIENLLIGFVFLYSSLGLFIGSNAQRRVLLIFQLLLWTIFFFLVIFYWGAVTTLSIFTKWLYWPDSLILSLIGLIGIVLSIINLSKIRNLH